jgi:hypothetical protein
VKLQADVFPAEALFFPPDTASDIDALTMQTPLPAAGKRLGRIRIVVINDGILIGQDSPTGIVVIFKEAIVQYKKENRVHKAQTASGKFVIFSKDTNCGCGSRLKSWNPYGKILYS